MPSSRRVERIAILAHDDAPGVPDAVSWVRRRAEEKGVEVAAEDGRPDLALVLGGDGSMLRAFHIFLATGVPALGVNFGRVGFLTSIAADELEQGVERVLDGDFTVVEFPTLDVRIDGKTQPAVNDVVATSSRLGHMVELGYAVGDEDLGVLPCDGVLCATPSGSTAYNLSNGGPVLVWGLDAMVVTFIAPHSLHVRPLVVPHSRDVTITNRTAEGSVTVLVDGRDVGKLELDEQIEVQLGAQTALLATLPERTFFTRYRATFAS
jgi:NAD+ kinase